MLLLWLLLIPSIASLKCFSSFEKTSVVAPSNEICGVEINAYNLKCLQPTVVPLLDVETVFATTFKNVNCRIKGHHLKCGCNTDNCNEKWDKSWISSFNRQNTQNNRIFDCITAKCEDGSCKAFGLDGVKAFNHYEMPMINTATPQYKKPTISTTMENVLLWVISGFILLSWLLVIVASFTFGGGLRPNNGRNTASPEDELPLDGPSAQESAAAASGASTTQTSAKPSEATTKSKK